MQQHVNHEQRQILKDFFFALRFYLELKVSMYDTLQFDCSVDAGYLPIMEFDGHLLVPCLQLSW